MLESEKNTIAGTTPFVTMAMPPMPIPGTPGAPHFNGNNVTAFLEEWDYLCQDYYVTGKAKLLRILRYVDVSLRDQIKALPEYMELEQGNTQDETKFYVALKKLYRDRDLENLKMSRDFLNSICRGCAGGELDVKTFLETFHRISTVLISRGQLGEIERCNMLTHGLPTKYARKILKDEAFDSDDVATWNYDKMYRAALNECKFEEKALRFYSSRDPDFSKVKEQFIDSAVHTMVQPKQSAFALPTLPIAAAGTSFPYDGRLKLETQDPQLQNERKESPREETTTKELDTLSRAFEQLQISTAERDRMYLDMQRNLEAQTSVIKNLVQQQQSMMQPEGRPRGRSFGASGNKTSSSWAQTNQDQGSYSQGTQGPPRPERENPVKIQGNAVTGDYRRPKKCYGCWGLTANGDIDPNCQHAHTDQCPEIRELLNRRCIFKGQDSRYYLGEYHPDKIAYPLILTSDSPWLRQIHSRINGTEFDYDLNARETNKARLKEDARVATEARNQPQTASAASTRFQGNYTSIVKRGQLIPPVHQGTIGTLGVKGPGGKSIDDLVEERKEHVEVYAVTQSGRVQKPTDKARELKEILKRKAAAEEQMAHARSRRASAYVPQAGQEGEMDIDETESEAEEEIGRPDMRRSQDTETLREEVPLRRRATKLTVPLPKMRKSYKVIAESLKTPNPAATLLVQWQQANQPFIDVLDMAGEIGHAMKNALSKLRAPSPALGTVVAPKEPIQLDGNALSLTYEKLVREDWIVSTPKVRVNIMGTHTNQRLMATLDTGAECNILPLSVANQLGCTILDISDFRLSSVNKDNINFAGIARMRVEIEDGFGCDTAFFLIEGSPKILLGQPFTRKMKVTLEHREDGSMDGHFIDPVNPQFRCKAMVVPAIRPLDSAWNGRKQRRKVDSQPYVETEEEENE